MLRLTKTILSFAYLNTKGVMHLKKNIVCCFVLVWNDCCFHTGQYVRVWEQGAENNARTKQGGWSKQHDSWRYLLARSLCAGTSHGPGIYVCVHAMGKVTQAPTWPTVIVFAFFLWRYQKCNIRTTDITNDLVLISLHSLVYSNFKTCCLWIHKKTKLRGLSPRANYTDRAAAAGRRS